MQGIAGSQKLEFMFSKLSIVRNCGFPKLETHGSKPEKVTLPVEGSVDCNKLELMVLNVVPQQQNALGSSAIVKVSEQTGAAPKPIPPRFPGSK